MAGLDMVLSESAAYVNTYDAWRVIFGLLRKVRATRLLMLGCTVHRCLLICFFPLAMR